MFNHQDSLLRNLVKGGYLSDSSWKFFADLGVDPYQVSQFQIFSLFLSPHSDIWLLTWIHIFFSWESYFPWRISLIYLCTLLKHLQMYFLLVSFKSMLCDWENRFATVVWILYHSSSLSVFLNFRVVLFDWTKVSIHFYMK